MHVLIGLAGLLVTFMVALSLHRGIRISQSHVPLVDASSDIKLEVALAHLWFEEILAGDRFADMETVWRQLRKADGLARTMLEGGEIQGMSVPALAEEALRARVLTLRETLADLSLITRERWEMREASAAGTALDQHYDSVFDAFLQLANELSGELQNRIALDLGRFRLVQGILIPLCLALTLVMNYAFYRFDRHRSRNIDELHQAHLDLTDEIRQRKRVQKELVRLNRDLDGFVSMASHDLRKPLTPIMGYAEFLQMEYGDRLDEQGMDMLREIEKQAERMEELLEDLLMLSRTGHVKQPETPVCTEGVVHKVLRDLRSSNPELSADVLLEKLPELRIAPTLLEQLFGNLLGNALKYAGSCGPVRLGATETAEGVEFCVEDHGPGIPKAERELIFHPFYRGSSGRHHQGTGVGLATVKKITGLCRGKVWVEETPGGGCTFKLFLPGDNPQHRRDEPA